MYPDDWDISEVNRGEVPLDPQHLLLCLPTPCEIQELLGVKPLTDAYAHQRTSEQFLCDYASALARAVRDETIARFGVAFPAVFVEDGSLRGALFGGGAIRRLDFVAITIAMATRQNPPNVAGVDRAALVNGLLKLFYRNLGYPVERIPDHLSTRDTISAIAEVLRVYEELLADPDARLTTRPLRIDEYEPFLSLRNDAGDRPSYGGPHIAIRGPFTGVVDVSRRREIDIELHAAIESALVGARLTHPPQVSTGRSVTRKAREQGLLHKEEPVSNINLYSALMLPIVRSCDGFIYHDLLDREPPTNGFSKAQVELRVASGLVRGASARMKPILDLRVDAKFQAPKLIELNGYTAGILPTNWTDADLAHCARIWAAHALSALLHEAWERRLRTYHEYPQFLQDREAIAEIVDFDGELCHWSELPVTLPSFMRAMRPDFHRT